jgi:transcriptional regulator with XRE-family HTH domain
MADFCRRLRDARERANLSIEEISARTKIGVSALHALERGDFERLPGDFYTRAFLRTYARELHVAPEEVLREYGEFREASHPAATQVPAASAAAQPRERDTDYLRGLDPAWRGLHPRNWTGWTSVLVAAFLLLGLVLFAPRSREAQAPSNAVGTAGAGTAPMPAPTTGEAEPAAPDKLVLEIRPSARIWVAATADGASAIYRLLKPGERVVLEAQKELSFRIGDAGAFVYTLNGVPGKPVGGPGEVREFEITKDNYRTYLR